MTSFFQKQVEFIFGANTVPQLNHGDLQKDMPEWAIVGRSNVGKSSLINALFNRKKLARTSNTPGRTRQINFFNCDNQCLLADLPGYGYAKISKEDRAQWNRLIDAYLTQRPNLRFVLLLIDSRHDFKDIDHEMMLYLDQHAVPYAIIMTKTDKSSKAQIDKLRQTLQERLKFHPAAMEHILDVSAMKKKGLSDLQQFIELHL